MSGHAQPTITVVIPTYRRRASLERVLGGLAKQAWPPERLQVLVISDGWNDSSVEMALALQLPYQLRVFEQANQGPAAARNLGLAQAEGDLILFLDDDVVPCVRLVAEHARSHNATPDLVVIGPMLEPPRPLLARHKSRLGAGTPASRPASRSSPGSLRPRRLPSHASASAQPA